MPSVKSSVLTATDVKLIGRTKTLESKNSPHDDRFTQTADGWTETFTGKRFFFENPTPGMVDVADIAHSLALLCRYGGHCRVFYSVAEHSWLLADWYLDSVAPGYAVGRSVPTAEQAETAFALLMHDASEAYLIDVPRPVKARLPDYKRLEAPIEAAIAGRFRMEYPHPRVVREADGRIIVDERAQVMSRSGNDWAIGGLEPLGVSLRAWSPGVAEFQFKDMFRYLQRLRGRAEEG